MGGLKVASCQCAHLKQSCNVFLVTLGVMMDRVLLLFGLVVLATSHAVSINLLSDLFVFVYDVDVAVNSVMTCPGYVLSRYLSPPRYMVGQRMIFPKMSKSC